MQIKMIKEDTDLDSEEGRVSLLSGLAERLLKCLREVGI
jgi:hypothetical protein